MEVQEEPLWSANFVEIVEKPHGEIGQVEFASSQATSQKQTGAVERTETRSIEDTR